MTSRTRSSGGCWTCRLRRKKCDETRPVCEACDALGIDCLYSEEKPQWMDGGDWQKARGEWVKQEIKRVAAQRREKRYMRDLEEGVGGIGADDGSGVSMEIETGTARTGSSTTASTSILTPCSSSASSPPQHQASNDSPDEDHAGIPASESDAHRTMFYLDYVFPFLFPFYCLTLLDFGRGWLLVLLQRNQALFHVAQTMAGYFYGIVLASDDNKDDVPELCKSHNLVAIQRQQELGLQWLRRAIQDVVDKGVKGHVKEASEVVACIVQLLTSEVAVGNSENWRVHLEAAAGLWEEMWRFHGVGKIPRVDGEGDIEMPCFMMLLLQLGSSPNSWTPRGQPWGANQATLRFFSAQLLFLDVVGSTALEQAPRLQTWHGHLLEVPDMEEIEKVLPAKMREKEMEVPHLKLVEFIGLENWVVVAIAEISALDAFKKEMKRTSSLSVAQLVSRAAMIENRIRTGLEGLGQPEVRHGCPSECLPADHPLLHFTPQRMSSPHTMHSTALHTRIWAQAALTYLQVVVSGWQPASQEIQNTVTETLHLMIYCLPVPDSLRALVWPFTVTGCLAAPEQEQIFRDMAGAMGPLRAFGTIKQGMDIMEHVWSSRAHIEQNADQWDLAACLNCLGQPSLLI
ncbi:fungal-specific transcription factor domain-containing protein, partial [Triangularia verruculosa]